MKLLLILFSCICFIRCYDKTDNRFYSEDGRFKVNFTTKPVVKNQLVKNNSGNFILTTFFSKISELEKHYASYAVYDYSVKNNDDKKILLENSKNHLLSQLEIDITYEKDTIINNYTGNIFKATDGNYYVSILQLIDNSRVFQVGIMKNDNSPVEQEFLKLINSFEIIKPIAR